MTVEVSGSVQRVIYRSEDSGYTVMQLDAAGGNQAGLWPHDVSSVGVISPAPQVGEELTLIGEWTKHPKYGDQFKFSRVGKRQIQQTEEGITAYLSSGLFAGIGPARAAALVSKFGVKIGEIIESDPSKLAMVRGVTEDIAQQIAKTWRENEDTRETMTWLCGIGLSTAYAKRIFATFGNASVERVKENPYQLAELVEGIGFAKADEIAALVLENQYSAHLPYRVEAGLAFALRNARKSGHTYLPLDELVQSATNLLKVPADLVVETLVEMVKKPQSIVIKDGDRYYLPKLFEAEQQVAERLLKLVENGGNLSDIAQDVGKLIKSIEDGLSFELTDQQRSATVMALTNKVSVITGGPGVGKSTILKVVTDVAAKCKKVVLLCAPTGRAAKRMQETTGVDASTIHRLLGYRGTHFEANEDCPLDADLVIVDEFSMVDISLAYSLIRALKPSTHLLVVGDADQLPSVGPGDVLNDLIRSDVLPVARLTTIFRQAQESRIVTNAHRINAGEIPSLESSGDFFFVEANGQEQIGSVITEGVIPRLQVNGWDANRDVQVLAPMYRGDAGVNEINRRLREQLNPRGNKAEHKFRTGDKIMQLSNDYEKEVYNGDVGFVEGIDLSTKSVHVKMDDRVIRYGFDELDQLTFAWCSTIHKSQGSEYPVVVIPVTNGHYVMLRRNLIYTAITRGKKMVILVGEKKAIKIAVERTDTSTRHTALVERLKLYAERAETPITAK